MCTFFIGVGASLRGLLVLSLAALAGCASVTSGVQQPVAVTPVCEGVIRTASCELRNDKGAWKIQAPGRVDVRKSANDLVVSCTSGPAAGTANFTSKSGDGLYGNFLVGGVIGAAVDAASGAGFRYPDELPVILVPPCEGATGQNEIRQPEGERK